ncbi:MAG: cation:proton antiporter, partial [Gammaproteobacteria bacterium]|nr:cation:proton antiporter [Gammaproteobacteria bacterium]
LALSSTAFVLQLLSEQKLLTSTYGRTSISVLLLQDLAVVPLLVLVPLLAMPELSLRVDIGIALTESLIILVLVILIGRYLLHPVLHRVALSGNAEVFTASAVLIVLGAALATEHAGLSMAMGAFLAGLLISDSSYKHQVMAEVRPFRGILLGLFFMSMGMSLNLDLLLDGPLVSLGLMGILIFIKAAILLPLVYLFGLKLNISFAVALILAQSGEFALVLFSLAFQSNLLTDTLFQQLLLIVLLSMLITPLLSYFASLLITTKTLTQNEQPAPPITAPIVLAGFGRVGRRIGEILTLADRHYVALDSDAALVEKERSNGFPVFYGDACNPELLKAAGANHAQLIIVTLNNPVASEQLVSTFRKSHPDTIIYARGHSLNQCRELRRLGASGAVSENIEASLELARLALTIVDGDHEKQQTILDGFRRKYYSQIDDISNL